MAIYCVPLVDLAYDRSDWLVWLERRVGGEMLTRMLLLLERSSKSNSQFFFVVVAVSAVRTYVRNVLGFLSTVAAAFPKRGGFDCGAREVG